MTLSIALTDVDVTLERTVPLVMVATVRMPESFTSSLSSPDEVIGAATRIADEQNLWEAEGESLDEVSTDCVQISGTIKVKPDLNGEWEDVRVDMALASGDDEDEDDFEEEVAYSVEMCDAMHEALCEIAFIPLPTDISEVSKKTIWDALVQVAGRAREVIEWLEARGMPEAEEDLHEA